MNVSKIAPYAKTVVAILGALVVIATALSDGTLSGEEVVVIFATLGAAFGVYQVPNKAT